METVPRHLFRRGLSTRTRPAGRPGRKFCSNYRGPRLLVAELSLSRTNFYGREDTGTESLPSSARRRDGPYPSLHIHTDLYVDLPKTKTKTKPFSVQGLLFVVPFY